MLLLTLRIFKFRVLFIFATDAVAAAVAFFFIHQHEIPHAYRNVNDSFLSDVIFIVRYMGRICERKRDGCWREKKHIGKEFATATTSESLAQK